MVKVGGSLWLYTYEASRPDASSSGAGINGDRACSNAAVVPWTTVTYAEADAACKAAKDSTGASMRLCTQAEWDLACFAGNAPTTPTWSYGSTPTVYSAGRCNDVDGATPSGAWTTGSASQCFANWGAAGSIFDLSGNVGEWTSSCVSLNGKTYCNVQGGNSQSLPGGTLCGFDFTLAQQTFENFDLGFRCCSDHAP